MSKVRLLTLDIGLSSLDLTIPLSIPLTLSRAR